MPMTTRRVMLDGRLRWLAGDAGDSFFQWAPHHLAGMEQLGAVARAVLPGGDGVVVDVGANIGLSALVLARVAARLVCVEAAPATAAALRETLRLNGLDAEVLELALGAAPGEVAFLADAHSAGASLAGDAMLGSEGKPRVTVPVTTLDALALPRCDLVKLDVEGWETEVLDGAQATLARHRPTVVAEFNAWVLQANRNLNPRAVLEDWLARFPVVHALRGAAAPLRLGPATLLDFLHQHLVERGCADELVLGFDDDWVARYGA